MSSTLMKSTPHEEYNSIKDYNILVRHPLTSTPYISVFHELIEFGLAISLAVAVSFDWGIQMNSLSWDNHNMNPNFNLNHEYNRPII